MKALHIRKRFVLVVFMTILLTLFCAPIYSNNLVSGLWQSRFINKTARVDIHILGGKNSKVEVVKADWEKSGVSYPQWCDNNYRQCAVFSNKIASKWRTYTVKFKVNGGGKTVIALRGPEAKGGNKERYPVLVDYRFATVNGEAIGGGCEAFWHDKPLKYVFETKDGEVVTLSFEARKHHWRFGDLQYYSLNGLLFLSVLILSFLFCYKVVQYMSKFKLLEANSRIDIVFVVAFIGLLFVPMSHISTAKVATQENRMMATYPHLFKKTLNLNYGKQFEKWFNDHFLSRDLLIDLYSMLKREVNIVYENGNAFLLKNSNWMFIYNADVILPKNPDKIVENFKKFNEFTQQNNIDFYVLIVPSKHSVYHEYLQEYSYDMGILEKYDQWLDGLVKSEDLRVVYPYDALRKAKDKDFVFFKQTHHWTDWGAYIGYRELMKKIAENYPNIHISNLDEYKRYTSKLIREGASRKFEYGQTTNLLKIQKEYALKHILKDDYVYYDHKKMITPEVVDIAYNKSKYYQNKNQKKAPRAMVIGTSQNENLMQFLPYSFSELKFLRINGVKNVPSSEEFKLMKRFRQTIIDYKPDILILSVTTNNIRHGLSKIMEE